MSLGGATSIVLATRHPHLVRRLLLVDITPGVDGDKTSDIAAFLAGPETFATFDEILDRTIQFNPTRSVSSFRRGVLHNSVQLPDGTWAWRHQVGRPPADTGLHVERADFQALWDALQAIPVPVLLARGSRSPVVDDADVAEFLRRRPGDAVIVVEDAGHSIQGDKPLELAAIIEEIRPVGLSSSRTPRMFVSCSLLVHFAFRWPRYVRSRGRALPEDGREPAPPPVTNTEEL